MSGTLYNDPRINPFARHPAFDHKHNGRICNGYPPRGMSGSEELPNSEEIEVEGVEGADGAEGGEGMEEYDDEEIAQMQKDLAKAEQQKAELEKLQKMQGGGAATPEKPGQN